MSLQKQAKVMTPQQERSVLFHISQSRDPIRNKVIFLLSVKAGLRAKEIASLRWFMLIESDGSLGNYINLTNDASKGKGGRKIPLNASLKSSLTDLLFSVRDIHTFTPEWSVIRTERSATTSPQVIVNLFRRWYGELGFVGCSSHSGRRTFITNTAKKISLVGGSMRDIQELAGHSSLQITQRYIEGDELAKQKVVGLI
jgi:integrase/recombinase XerD